MLTAATMSKFLKTAVTHVSKAQSLHGVCLRTPNVPLLLQPCPEQNTPISQPPERQAGRMEVWAERGSRRRRQGRGTKLEAAG